MLDAEVTHVGTEVFFICFQNQETLWGHEVLFSHFEEEEAEPQRAAPSHPVGGGRREELVASTGAFLLSIPPCLPRFPECPLGAWHDKGAGSLLPESVLDGTTVRIFLNL